MQTLNFKSHHRIIAVLLVTLLLLAACGGDDPTPEAAQPAPTETTAPTHTPEPTHTPAPTHTPEPTSAPTESPLPTPGDRGIGDSPVATPAPGAESPLATPDPEGIDMPDITLWDQQIERARAQLVEEVDGISADEITLVNAEAVDWPDSSLGCPQPGMMYAQVITPGYKIVLEAGGVEYSFHTDANPDGQLILCTQE